jgi:antitoxin (DNA-binding transcriptional repressor) of toxin-antitoxin stability system
MSATFTVEEAQARLKELIVNLSPGEEVIIAENQQPVAKLVAARAAGAETRNLERDCPVHGPGFRRPAGGF